MCFSIPAKVIDVKKSSILIEGNKEIRIEKDLKIKKGDYVQIIGSIVVDKLSNAQGLKIRKLLKSLNT
jgi:hydrogenase maturation factor